MTAKALVLNPYSGDAIHQPTVLDAAKARGWTVLEMRPGTDPVDLAKSVDVEVLAVAGGDGTVSAVASVAVERQLPLVVVPCGTRNHFALDAGIDVADPASGLAAAEVGEELLIDVGFVNGKLFLNNVSIGFYSSIVQDPRYRDRRVAVTVRYLRQALLHSGAPMTASLTVPPRITSPEDVLTILVSNNSYSPGIAPGAALRPRLDEGVLWVHLLGTDDGRGTARRVSKTVLKLLLGLSQVAAWPAPEVAIDVDRDELDAGVDGEAITLIPPLRLTCERGALRLLVPKRAVTSHRRVELHA